MPDLSSLTPGDQTKALLHRFSTDEMYYAETFGRIVDEHNLLVPFRIANRPMQLDFVKRIITPKVPFAVELKARRVGGTSLFMMLGLTRVQIRKNYSVLLLAQSDPDSIAFMREGFQRYYTNQVERVQMPDGSMFVSKAEIGTWSDHIITFPKTGGRIVAATAGSIRLGRGQGFDMIVGTEVARWDVGRPPGTAEECWAMAIGASSDKAEILAIQESTAYGAGGFFYDTYMKAKRGENGYAAMFYDWRYHPAYRYELGDLRAMPDDRGAISLSDEEKKLGLTIEQARWRRATIAGLGSLGLFLQEDPEDDETCFRVSGDPFFDIAVVDRKIMQARPMLTVSESGRLKMWQTPRIGERYIVAIDPGGEGVDRKGAQERDYDAVGVFDSRLTHVATLHGRWDTRTIADMVCDLAKYFNDALIVVESGPWGEALLLAIVSYLRYKNVYYERDAKGKPIRAGIRATESMRDRMAGILKETFESGTFRTDDKDLLAEMRNYQRMPTPSGRLRLEARAGHDDLVSMAQLAAYVWSEGRFGVGAGRTRIFIPGRQRTVQPTQESKVVSFDGKGRQGVVERLVAKSNEVTHG